MALPIWNGITLWNNVNQTSRSLGRVPFRTGNIVGVPKSVHQQISNFYSTTDPTLGMTPRQYMKQRQYGLDVLNRFLCEKPRLQGDYNSMKPSLVKMEVGELIRNYIDETKMYYEFADADSKKANKHYATVLAVYEELNKREATAALLPLRSRLEDHLDAAVLLVAELLVRGSGASRAARSCVMTNDGIDLARLDLVHQRLHDSDACASGRSSWSDPCS